MKRRNLKPYTLVAVKWQDTQSHSGWHYEPRPFGPVDVDSVGFVAPTPRDSESLTLVSSLAFNKDATAGQRTRVAVLDALSIPWGCIKGVKRL